MSSDSYLEQPQEIRAVRGPRTFDRYRDFAIECPSVFGDPAILLPRFLEATITMRSGRVGVVPHYTEIRDVREMIRGLAGLILIDVRYSINDFVEAVTSCECVVSSSLHGVIIAHAYGIPARHIIVTDRLSGDGVKFQDYYESLGMTHRSTPVSEGKDLIAAAHHVDIPDQRTLAQTATALLAACPFGQVSGP